MSASPPAPVLLSAYGERRNCQLLSEHLERTLALKNWVVICSPPWYTATRVFPSPSVARDFLSSSLPPALLPSAQLHLDSPLPELTLTLSSPLTALPLPDDLPSALAHVLQLLSNHLIASLSPAPHYKALPSPSSPPTALTSFLSTHALPSSFDPNTYAALLSEFLALPRVGFARVDADTAADLVRQSPHSFAYIVREARWPTLLSLHWRTPGGESGKVLVLVHPCERKVGVVVKGAVEERWVSWGGKDGRGVWAEVLDGRCGMWSGVAWRAWDEIGAEEECEYWKRKAGGWGKEGMDGEDDGIAPPTYMHCVPNATYIDLVPKGGTGAGNVNVMGKSSHSSSTGSTVEPTYMDMVKVPRWEVSPPREANSPLPYAHNPSGASASSSSLSHVDLMSPNARSLSSASPSPSPSPAANATSYSASNLYTRQGMSTPRRPGSSDYSSASIPVLPAGLSTSAKGLGSSPGLQRRGTSPNLSNSLAIGTLRAKSEPAYLNGSGGSSSGTRELLAGLLGLRRDHIEPPGAGYPTTTSSSNSNNEAMSGSSGAHQVGRTGAGAEIDPQFALLYEAQVLMFWASGGDGVELTICVLDTHGVWLRVEEGRATRVEWICAWKDASVGQVSGKREVRGFFQKKAASITRSGEGGVMFFEKKEELERCLKEVKKAKSSKKVKKMSSLSRRKDKK